MFKFFQIAYNSNRIFGLDILRALAIIFVVLGHSAYILPRPFYFKYIGPFVFNGVSIFFVLSGYLIGNILLKEFSKENFTLKSLFNFWIRRWFRTVPNYFLVLIVLIIISFNFDSNFKFDEIGSYFLFSQNVFYEHPSFFAEAWSISIEEWFYLIVPLLLFILLRLFKFSLKQAVFIVVVLIITSVTLFRLQRHLTLSEYNWDLVFRKQVFMRLDSLMYGIIGAYIFTNYHFFWKKYKLLFFILGILLFLFTKFDFYSINNVKLFKDVFSFTIDSVATLFLLPLLSSIKSGKGILYKSLTHISLISYSMYLINLTLVQIWIVNSINWEFVQDINWDVFRVGRYFFYWFLVISISTLMYKYFEMPVMKLRERL